jgi:hypothetical protein
MTLWLTLLLVWTTGIPAALFVTATLAATMGERRAARIPPLMIPRNLRAAAPGCGRRTHVFGRPSVSGARPVRVHAGSRRRF